MKTIQPLSSSNLSLPPESYIYKLQPISNHLACVSSDDSVRLFDAKTLQLLPDGVLKNVHKSVTCLKRYGDQQLVTAGRDGACRWWDSRTGKMVLELKTPKKVGFSALECNSDLNIAIAGTELEGNGPGEAPVFIWDTRKPGDPRLQFVESHTDTVTELLLHPNRSTALLSASTDGLVNIFDITQSEEDDALYQVMNHKSAVQHAGFLNNDDVFALGTDETLAIYRLQTPDENAPEPDPLHFGDVREPLDCEYVAGLVRKGGDLLLAAGKHSDQRMDLIPMTPSAEKMEVEDTVKDSIVWSYDASARMRLSGGHGEEIVRDVYINDEADTAYTCGEDGMVRAWRLEGTPGDELKSSSSKKAKKEKKGKDGRFKPY